MVSRQTSLTLGLVRPGRLTRIASGAFLWDRADLQKAKMCPRQVLVAGEPGAGLAG
ncbi:MAG: hypothetical protein JSW27_21705 [Phycisphaerales bacterium]|nr:MAG: hypothetical protein JSW27_21705 [Phycisphaerales bacterium]